MARMETGDKPTGVIVLTVLFAVNGITLLIFSFKFLIKSFGLTLYGMEGVMLIAGILSLLEAKWIWELKSWARIVGIILALLSLPIALIFSIGALYFLLLHKETVEVLTKRRKIPSEKMAKKPVGVIVVAVLLAINGLDFILGGISFVGYTGPTPVSPAELLSVFGIGTLQLVATYGIWNLEKWARAAGIILSILNLLVGIIFGFEVFFIYSIGILYFLLVHEETKQFFGEIKNM